MIDYVYLLRVVDPENGKVVEYRTFHDVERAFSYLRDKIEKEKVYYDHYIKRIGVTE